MLKKNFLLKETIMLRIFGLAKIPMVWFTRPRVIKIDDKEAIVCIKLKRRNKNHLNSMYFGALCVGADLVGGLCAFNHAMKRKKKMSLVFKSFHANFLKRADGDVIFVNKQGEEISQFVDKVLASKERMNLPIDIVAMCPDKYGDEIIAKFTLELSLKSK